ncbi:MAG: sulfatase-like hydrolase/transferase, partial [Planctomycetaceae bacterium]
MNRFYLPLVLLAVTTAMVSADDRPNFLVIMVDDMGFSDPGCYGGEVDTPHLDQLAANGLRFTQFYNTARCWPSRAALMTGRYPHEAGHAMMYGNKAPRAYRGTTPDQGRFVSELLGPMGYRCYHVGKWHLQNRAVPRPARGKYASPQYNDSWPLGRGFHQSYCMKSQNNFFNPNQVFEEDKLVKRPGHDQAYYATDAFTDRTIGYLKDHAKRNADEPFFLYLAHTAPHFPLHALPDDIARHKQRYQRGWDRIRTER